MNNNFFFYLSKLSVQVILDVVYFPLWWYSIGLLRVLNDLRIFLGERWTVIGAGVWLKNIFVPMYGQTDMVSRAISFVIRFIQIIVRFVIFVFFVVISLVALFIWLALPVGTLVVLFRKLF